MTATKRAVLRGFIDDPFVEPADDAREEVLSPATGAAIAKAPLSSRRMPAAP
jgi:hypothetical protein